MRTNMIQPGGWHAIVKGLFWSWLGLSAGLAWGQGFIIHENNPDFRMPRHGHPQHRSYRVASLNVDATIKNQLATTQVTQVFENTGSVPIEATFVFPLPYDGAVDKLTFLVDGREIEAKLLPADQARSIYEGYIRRNQDPALLEWVGHGMFKSSVFPLPVGATRTVTLRYSQLLRKDQQLFDYQFPMSAAKFTNQPLDVLSLRLAIEGTDELKSIYSPSHNVEVTRDDVRHAVVRHRSEKVIPNSDFRLLFDEVPGKVSANVLSYWPADEDQGYFVLLASPEVKAASDVPLRKTVLFVVDQSGSMSGTKIDQAREAAKFVLQNLRTDDLFNIIRYESTVSTMSPELQRFDEPSRASALGFINGIQSGGGTNIDGALRAAMGQLQADDVPPYVVFLTDGLPTVGETNELKIARACTEANKVGARLITFGVGYDVNSRLLDRLARENNGQSEYVRPNENIEVAVSNLYKKLAAPVLGRLQLTFHMPGTTVAEGDVVNRMYPQKLTDLFAGSQLVVVGRYRKAGAARFNLTGQLGKNQPAEFAFEVNLAEKGVSNGYGFVRQLWAVRRVGELIDLLDLQGRNDELIRELVELSTRHGIVTPFTSYLADENQKASQLSKLGENQDLSRGYLERFANQESGADAFGGRSIKQSLKTAENAAALELPGMADGRQLGGMGGGAGRINVGGQPAAGDGSPSNFSGLRKIGNRTLYQRGKLLIADNAAHIDPEQDPSIVKIRKFSEDYFRLVAENSEEENALLAQQDQEELLVLLRGKTYLIQNP